MANQVSTTFPDSTYTSANKPSVETLKTDIAAIETAHNASDTSGVKKTDTDVSSNSFVLDEDAMGSDSNQKLATQQSIKAYVDAAIVTATAATKEALFPVGSTYVNYSVATNPGTLLGFGTWVAITNEVLVGKGSGTFASIGSVGAETTTLTGAQSGEKGHNHTQNQHRHGCNSDGGTQDAFEGNFRRESQDVGDIYTNYATATNNAVPASNASSAHSNVQNSRVVYMWRRSE